MPDFISLIAALIYSAINTMRLMTQKIRVFRKKVFMACGLGGCFLMLVRASRSYPIMMVVYIVELLCLHERDVRDNGEMFYLHSIIIIIR